MNPTTRASQALSHDPFSPRPDLDLPPQPVAVTGAAVSFFTDLLGLCG